MMISKTVAIAFLVRNCEKTLPVFLKRIERIRSYFADSWIFIVENDSKDASRSLLKQYETSHESVILFSFDDPALDNLSRMERMACLRNKCLDLVENSGYEPDYYIVVDSDLDFSPASVRCALQKAPEDWAALFANGKYYLKFGMCRIPVLYYDLFAYLPDKVKIGRGDSLTQKQMLKLRWHTRKEIKKNRYLKCRSAYGGLGIYRYDAVMGCRYAAEKNVISHKFDQLCEHIPFNREVSKQGALYVCRDLKVYYEAISVRRWLTIWVKANFRSKALLKMQNMYHTVIRRR